MLPPVHFWLTGSALFALGAFAFNALVSFLGMPAMHPRLAMALRASAVILSVLTWWSAATGEQKSNADDAQTATNSTLIQKIAIASGIDPSDNTAKVAQRILWKKLGRESANLSDEIFAYLRDADTDSFIPRSDHWQEDTQKMMLHSKSISAEYDKRFQARALSLKDQISESGFRVKDTVSDEFFEHPTNTLGMREVASFLGRAGISMQKDEFHK